MICWFALYGTAGADPRQTTCTNAGGDWTLTGGGNCMAPPGKGACNFAVGSTLQFYDQATQFCRCGSDVVGGCQVLPISSRMSLRPPQSGMVVNDLELLNSARSAVVSRAATAPIGTLDNRPLAKCLDGQFIAWTRWRRRDGRPRNRSRSRARSELATHTEHSGERRRCNSGA